MSHKRKEKKIQTHFVSSRTARAIQRNPISKKKKKQKKQKKKKNKTKQNKKQNKKSHKSKLNFFI
jgi:hypothetical protein